MYSRGKLLVNLANQVNTEEVQYSGLNNNTESIDLEIALNNDFILLPSTEVEHSQLFTSDSGNEQIIIQDISNSILTNPSQSFVDSQSTKSTNFNVVSNSEEVNQIQVISEDNSISVISNLLNNENPTVVNTVDTTNYNDNGIVQENQVLGENFDTTQNTENNKKLEEETKKSRKRTLHLDKWKKNVGKKNRNAGKSYTNSRGTLVAERKLQPVCNSCIFKCSEKFASEEREQIFQMYWAISNLQEQRQFVSKSMERIEAKKGKENRRKSNMKYYLTKNDARIRVCKTFFLNTLGISDRAVRTTKEKSVDGILKPDSHGKHCHHKTVPELVKKSVIDHINSIPRIESHYLRAQTTREYIDGSKSVSDLYRDYKQDMEDSGRPFATYITYYRIFNKSFNLSFFVPKKDQCSFCEEFKNSTDTEKKKLQEKYNHHINEKQLSRQQKENDKEDARNGKCATAVFDLQAVLLTPCGDVNKFYYKSRLATYNFTIYNLGNKKGHCYIWHEGEGGRGVCEIGTCLFKFLSQFKNRNLPLILYSDNCSGQNKNKYMVCLLLKAVEGYNIPNIILNYIDKKKL